MRIEKALDKKKRPSKNEGTIAGIMPNGPKIANIIILSQYFGSSSKTRFAPNMISILLKLI